MIGAVEGGGSRIRCAVARSDATPLATASFPTSDPASTLPRIIEFFRAHPVEALGLAWFGPLDLRAGATAATPKPGWSDVALVEPLRRALEVPVVLETDVGAAAIAEHERGALRDADPAVYVTVGTGIGAGVLVGGRPVHGLVHPEMGHVLVPRDGGDTFDGVCPFHGRCLEGLVAAPALRARHGVEPDALPDDHPTWARLARYLGTALASVVLVLCPQRIAVGGGLMRRSGLREATARAMRDALGGYLRHDALTRTPERYLVAPALEEPGLAGALLLARRCLAR
ncbi:MAG: ROK family protein [Myxococcota bacterium]|nr:ROK family protein [Myxococcota bacterium]MDW8362545.1 ROK family protein [Myxococcales bacterium]